MDFETVVGIGKKGLSLGMSGGLGRLCRQKIPSGLGTDLYELWFPSPLTFAAFELAYPQICKAKETTR